MVIPSLFRAPSRLLLLIASGAYLASLPLPAFTCATGRSFLGYEVLLLGYAGLLTLDPRWFANLGVLLIMVGIWTHRPLTSLPSYVAPVTFVLALLSSVYPAAGCLDFGSAAIFSRACSWRIPLGSRGMPDLRKSELSQEKKYVSGIRFEGMRHLSWNASFESNISLPVVDRI